MAPFELVFIDADKPNNVNYFDWALRLSRPGSLIVVDNVVRGDMIPTGLATYWNRGLLVDDAVDQLAAFLPPLADPVDIYVYTRESSYAAALATTQWPELEASDVLANPGRGDIALE